MESDLAKLISDDDSSSDAEDIDLNYWNIELIKEPNLEHLKSECSVYLMWFLIFFFNGTETMSNIRNNRLPQIIALPRIIAPFKSEKNTNNNRPRLLFKEIR